MPDIDIAARANEIETVTVDGQTTTDRPLPELIEAKNHLAGTTALAGTDSAGRAKSGRSVLRVAQFKAGGAV